MSVRKASIKKVSVFGIRCPEPNDNGNIRHTLLVKVAAEDGTEGWGEAIAMWPEAVRAVAQLIEHSLASLIVGENPLHHEAIWRKLKTHVWWYGEGGLASMAISALDMAVWDLKGKLLGVPLYQLFGGKVWEEGLPACASIHAKHETHRENADEIAGYMAEGYLHVKIGFGKKGKARLGIDADRDIEFVRTVRETIGPDKGLIIDIGNQVRWDAAHAIKMARALEKYDVLWLEEPFHPSDIDSHKLLRRATSIRIGSGEREWTVDGYDRLLKTGVVDVFGVDPARVEGITAFLKIRELIGAAKRKFNAHAWSTAITTAASIHLSVSSPHCLMMELKPIPNPMQNELVNNPVTQRNGRVEAPEGPGLGVEVNEDAVKAYRFV